MNNLSVYAYLYFVLRELPYCEHPDDYEKLLPYNLTAEEIKI